MSSRLKPGAATLCWLLAVSLCAGSAVRRVPGDPIAGTGNVTRRWLTRDEFFSSAPAAVPVDDGAFALPANAAPPTQLFEGKLTLLETSATGSARVLRNTFDYGAGSGSPWTHLPPFSFEFVQNGSHLVAVRQGLVMTGSPAWNYIVGPGRVWREIADRGYMRASFPFALVERNQNCVHNGEMMFLFNRGANPSISNIRYQVTQETCLYFKLDLWGQVRASWVPGTPAGAMDIANSAAEEISAKLPTRPIAELPKDYPGARFNVENLTRSFRSPADITTLGVFINGVNYVGACPTRYGSYAFCDQMRLPSYSLAKSSFAGLALMWMGQKYGRGVYDRLIRDFVPESVAGGDWNGVTFANASDMATGHYLSAEREADESGPEEAAFLTAEAFTDKIALAFMRFPRRAVPGSRWVYQSHTTFILTRAMGAYLERRAGGEPLFEAIRDSVYAPLGISRGGRTTLRTDNSAAGQPFGGYGLFFTQDDIARIGRLLNNDEGRIGGKQILDPVRLRESLFRAPNPPGFSLPVPDVGAPAVPGTFRYHNQFWAKHVTPAEFPQYSCDFWISFMSGYGGNVVLLLPNGAMFYVFSDGNEFVWYPAVHEIAKIAPFCR